MFPLRIQTFPALCIWSLQTLATGEEGEWGTWFLSNSSLPEGAPPSGHLVEFQPEAGLDSWFFLLPFPLCRVQPNLFLRQPRGKFRENCKMLDLVPMSPFMGFGAKVLGLSFPTERGKVETAEWSPRCPFIQRWHSVAPGHHLYKSGKFLSDVC